MPILTFPIVNKFGILSEQQRLVINRRLNKKALSNGTDTEHSFSQNRPPLQVTEEFVQNYNRIKSLEEQKKYHAKAIQMLCRIKRNVSLSNTGTRKCVNVNLAWSELILLLKCKGNIQDESLDLLLMSLKNVSVDCNHVSVLLMMAYSLASQLNKHSAQQSFIRETHMKQLKVCQLIFMRLYYHKMANQLDRCQPMKKKLHSYYTSLSEYDSFYCKHPDAQLLFRFILQVAAIIFVDDDFENDELHRSSSHYFRTYLLPPVTPSKTQRESSSPETRCPSRHNSWVSKSMHELSAPLWHALNVWKCQTLCPTDKLVRDSANKMQQSFAASLTSLIKCTFNWDTPSCWVDYVIALNVLAEAAKRNLTVLCILQYLAYCGIYSSDRQVTKEDISPSHSAGNEDHQNYVRMKEPEDIKNGLNRVSAEETEECCFGFWSWDIIFIYTELLGDILLNGSTSYIQKRALMGDNSNIVEEKSCCIRGQSFQQIPGFKFQIDNNHTLNSISLLELASFESPYGSSKEPDDWSWRIRLGAIQALMKVYQCLLDEPPREVLLTTLQTILLQLNHFERNPSILEALHSNFFYSTKKTALSFRQTSLHGFMTHLADSLVEIYLPKLHGSKEQEKYWKQQQTQHNLGRNNLTRKLKETKSPIIHERKYTFSLRSKSIKTSNVQSYETRTAMNLQQVIRNQWDKENPYDLWEDLQSG